MDYFIIFPFPDKKDAFNQFKKSNLSGQVIEIPNKLGTAIYSHAIDENGNHIFPRKKIIIKDEIDE